MPAGTRQQRKHHTCDPPLLGAHAQPSAAASVSPTIGQGSGACRISLGTVGVYPASAETWESSGAPCLTPRLLPAARPPASPVVAAVRPRQLSARAVPLPGQQVQAAAEAGLHAEGPVGAQHLAWGAVAAGLAAPHAVLGDSRWALVSKTENRAGGPGRGALVEQRCGRQEAGEVQGGGSVTSQLSPYVRNTVHGGASSAQLPCPLAGQRERGEPGRSFPWWCVCGGDSSKGEPHGRLSGDPRSTPRSQGVSQTAQDLGSRGWPAGGRRRPAGKVQGRRGARHRPSLLHLRVGGPPGPPQTGPPSLCHGSSISASDPLPPHHTGTTGSRQVCSELSLSMVLARRSVKSHTQAAARACARTRTCTRTHMHTHEHVQTCTRALT